MGKKKGKEEDPTWQHCARVSDTNRMQLRCNYCGHVLIIIFIYDDFLLVCQCLLPSYVKSIDHGEIRSFGPTSLAINATTQVSRLFRSHDHQFIL